jgi:hypothetical protein
MVSVMSSKIAIVALLGVLAAGLGCHHIAGKSDCGYNPSDYPIGPPTPPYPTTPAPKVSDVIPKSKNGESDKPADKLFDPGLPGIDSGN